MISATTKGPRGLVVGGFDLVDEALVDGGDGVAVSSELHTPASLHFVSSK
jgi:hypothetical protein